NATGGRLCAACPVGALCFGSRGSADGVKGLSGRHERSHRSVAGALVFWGRACAARHRLVFPGAPGSTAPAKCACTDVTPGRTSLGNSTEDLRSSAASIPAAVVYYRTDCIAMPPLFRSETRSLDCAQPCERNG